MEEAPKCPAEAGHGPSPLEQRLLAELVEAGMVTFEESEQTHEGRPPVGGSHLTPQAAVERRETVAHGQRRLDPGYVGEGGRLHRDDVFRVCRVLDLEEESRSGGVAHAEVEVALPVQANQFTRDPEGPFHETGRLGGVEARERFLERVDHPQQRQNGCPAGSA